MVERENMIKHDRVYEVLLVFYAFAAFCTAALALLLPRVPFSEKIIQIPLSEKIIVLAFCLFLDIVTVVVLVLRLRKYRFMRIATRVVNIIYLLLPPFGTPIGIYGLLMVDRQKRQGEPSGTSITIDP
jgi:hypothetical protein